MKYELAAIACFLLVLVLMFQGQDARDNGYMKPFQDFVRSAVGIVAVGAGIAGIITGLLVS